MPNSDKIVFVQYQEPGLKAGDYRVEAELTVHNLPAETFPAATSYSIEKYLRVAGDRFALPPGTVDSVYPPANARGIYSRVLPHIVLNKPTLPWERTISDHSAPHTPWLFVLLLTEQELRDENLNLTAPTTFVTRKDNGVDIRTETLTLSANLWSRLAPTAAELLYLGHVRQVVPANKNDTPKPILEFSLVLGNRVPPPGESCYAFLVSLESLEDKLPPAFFKGNITLTVLHAWRFFAEARNRSFGVAIQSLDHNTGLSIPAENSGDATIPLSMGYTPAPHDLRVGGSTWSWYRGPFTPYGTQRRIKHDPNTPIDWADAVTLYDPTTGMMDVSCSAAWALGRLLALNDTTFVTTLYKSKREKVRDTVERMRFQLTFGTRANAGSLQMARRQAVEASLEEDLASALPALGGLPARTTQPHPPALRAAPPLLSAEARRLHLLTTLTDPQSIAHLHHLDDHLNLLHTSASAEPDPSTPDAIIAKWLGEAALFRGIPLHYLIPHERMLPNESIRFFQVDLSWLEALQDGALSIGSVTDTDTSHDQAFQPLLAASADRATAIARPQARHLLARRNAPVSADLLKKPLSGFLIRSEVLTQFPDMEIEGRVGETPAVTLRQQKMGPFLICLFDRIVDTVAIHQPSEGVHFGFRPGDDPEKIVKKHRAPNGEETPADPLKSIPWRDGGKQVLNILAVVKWMTPQPNTFHANQFALQMVTGVDRVVFTIGSA